MTVDCLLMLAGLAMLIVGSDFLVRGASGIAFLARLTPAVVGLTVVAAGTSMPELVVSVRAAIQGNPGLAVGNIVGLTSSTSPSSWASPPLLGRCAFRATRFASSGP